MAMAVLVRVMLNNRQVWPTGGWRRMEGNSIGTQWPYVANAAAVVPMEATAEVEAGDRLSFIVNKVRDPDRVYDGLRPYESLTRMEKFTGLRRSSAAIEDFSQSWKALR